MPTMREITKRTIKRREDLRSYAGSFYDDDSLPLIHARHLSTALTCRRPPLTLARTRFVIKVIIVVGFLLPAPFTPAGSRFLVVVVYRFRRLSRWRSRSNIARRGSNRCGFLRWRLCVNGLCGRSGGRWRLSLLDRWCSRGYRRGELGRAEKLWEFRTCPPPRSPRIGLPIV